MTKICVVERLTVLLSVWRTQGNLDEAEPLMRQGMAISEKVYGKEHPDYALKLNNLAELLLQKQASRSAVDKNLCC